MFEVVSSFLSVATELASCDGGERKLGASLTWGAGIDPRYEPKGLLVAGTDADGFHEDDDFGPNDDGLAVLALSFIIPGDMENPAGLSSDDVAVVFAVIDTEAAAGPVQPDHSIDS